MMSDLQFDKFNQENVALKRNNIRFYSKIRNCFSIQLLQNDYNNCVIR
jgi:hypothetical protein